MTTKILGQEFKDFKKGDLIKRLQSKYGKDKVNKNTSMKKLKELMGKKVGGVTEGIKKIKAKGLNEGGMKLSPKADLDGDGIFSKYERARGEAIQKAMTENKKVEGGIVRGGGQAIKGLKFKGVM